MSSVAATVPDDFGGAGEPDASFPSGQGTPRPWLAQTMLDTLGRTGARVGLVWIVIVAFCAIFAPLLANSFPILIKMDGRWSSPLARHLTPFDVFLPIATFGGIGIAFLRHLVPLLRLAIWVIAMIVIARLLFVFMQPPMTETYETYRRAEAEGRVQWVLHTPIPFSPGDHLGDQFDPDRPQPWPAFTPHHLLGTDTFGADLASHLIHACRIAMSIGFIATAIEFIIGVVAGGLMGYFVGAVDLLGMRIVEIFGAIPTIYLLLTFVAVFENRNIYIIMAIIGVTGWTDNARFVRAEFLRLRNQDFVQAAVASGLPLRAILFRHLLPNALAPLLVSVSFGVASAILYESVLSFLGLGVPVGEPSWGQLLNQAVSAGGGFYWWLAVFPGLAIFLTVLAYNLVGEAFRDATDPRLRGVS